MAPGVSRRESLGFLSSAAALTGARSSAAPLPVARVSVAECGARGDGVTDDTAAFQAALDSGADVWVPGTTRFYRLTRALTTRRAGQSIVGEGHASRLVQQGTGADATVLAMVHDDCTVTGLRLTPGDGGAPLYQGWALVLSKVARAVVRQCQVDGMRRGGVLVHESSDCVVRDNRFVDSIVRADGQARQAEMGYDVLIAGAAARNVVDGNECVSGCGTGIGCQTVTDGESQYDNVIRGNVVRGHPCYGIMIYLSGSRGRINGVVVVDNSIALISGAVRTDDRTYFYGAGIYVQTANDFLIANNHLRGTNGDRRLPPSGSAVPAAIAVSGRGNGTVSGNFIRDCIDGIASIQATGPVPAGEGTAITGNTISDCARIGINLADCAAATVVGNRLSGTAAAAHGILVLRADDRARLSDFTISANQVHRFHAGIELLGGGIERAVVSGNIVTAAAGYAIACGAAVASVTGNVIRGGNGISLPATAQHGTCRDNIVEGRGAAIARDRASGVAVGENVIIASSA